MKIMKTSILSIFMLTRLNMYFLSHGLSRLELSLTMNKVKYVNFYKYILF